MNTEKKLRVLITKVGLDCHDRGAKIVAAGLKEEGMEVIYLGRYQTPKNVVQAALQEDVDVIGVSCHCGEHLSLVPKILELLQDSKASHIPVVLGGSIPQEDVGTLKVLGIGEVFLSGSSLKQIAQSLRKLIPEM